MADPQAESSSSKVSIGLPSLSNGMLSTLGSRPSGSSGRLESFRTPRDLTLGSLSAPAVKQKRKFEPILPTKGKGKAPAPKPLVANSNEGAKKEPPAKKPKKQNDRNNKRTPKDRVNFIQTEGSVFGQGQADRQVRVRDHYVCSASSSSKKTEVFRPILRKEELIEVQDEFLESTEDEVVRKMKRSDFLDNPEPKASWGDSKPLTIHQSRTIKQEIKSDPDGDEESIPLVNIDVESPTVNSILSGMDDEIFLLQLPDCLPGRVEKEDDDQDSTSTARAKKSIPATLKDLPEGTMGFVEILKSGKTRIRLGSHIMYLEMGSFSNIRQELVMVGTNVEDKTGSMCDLGQVNHRMVCVPDWQHELAEASRK